jgi:hypothetical protein
MGPWRPTESPFCFSPRTLRAGVSREPHRGEVLVVMVRLLRTQCRGAAADHAVLTLMQGRAPLRVSQNDSPR